MEGTEKHRFRKSEGRKTRQAVGRGERERKADSRGIFREGERVRGWHKSATANTLVFPFSKCCHS